MKLTKEELLAAFNEAEDAVAEFEVLQEEYDSIGVIYNKEHALVNRAPDWLRVMFIMGGFYIGIFIVGVGALISEGNVYVTLLSIAVTVIGVMQLYNIVKKMYLNRPTNQKRKERMKNMENRGIEINRRADELIETVQRICPFLVEEYCYPVPFRTLVYYLQSGRAHDLESMINLYELEAYRGRMEQAQNELLREQQNQAAMLHNLERLHSSALDNLFWKR